MKRCRFIVSTASRYQSRYSNELELKTYTVSFHFWSWHELLVVAFLVDFKSNHHPNNHLIVDWVSPKSPEVFWDSSQRLRHQSCVSNSAYSQSIVSFEMVELNKLIILVVRSLWACQIAPTFDIATPPLSSSPSAPTESEEKYEKIKEK